MAVLLGAGIVFQFWHIRLSPVTVRVASVATNVPEQVFGLGMVGTRVQSNIGFKVAGVLGTLNADQGDHVAAGSILARLDDRDMQAQLQAARAGAAQAEANVGKAVADVASTSASLANAEQISHRRDSLVRTGVVSKEEAQTTDAAKRVARANLQVAQSEVVVAQAARAPRKPTLTESDYQPVISPLRRGRLPLGAEARLDGAAPAVMALVDPSDQSVLAFRLTGRVSFSISTMSRGLSRSRPA